MSKGRTAMHPQQSFVQVLATHVALAAAVGLGVSLVLATIVALFAA